MKTSIMMLSVLFTIMLCACMGSQGQKSANQNVTESELTNDSVVTIYENGVSSNGATFEVYNDSTFSFDRVIYVIVGSHLEVSGYNPTEIVGTELKIYPGIRFENIYFKTTKIRDNAFLFCQKEQIVVPNTIYYIGDFAFHGSSIEKIDIPSSVRLIGAGCFSGCANLKSVELSNGIEYIGPGVFMDCTSLTHLFIPKSVKQIWYKAFKTSTNTMIYLDGRPDGIFLEELGGGMSRVYSMGDYENQTLVVSGEKNYLWVKSTEPWCNYKKIEVW